MVSVLGETFFLNKNLYRSRHRLYQIERYMFAKFYYMGYQNQELSEAYSIILQSEAVCKHSFKYKYSTYRPHSILRQASH